jgi:hypothetical protein
LLLVVEVEILLELWEEDAFETLCHPAEEVYEIDRGQQRAHGPVIC